MHKGDIPNASGVLERIDTYGLDRAEYVDLERRYDNSHTRPKIQSYRIRVEPGRSLFWWSGGTKRKRRSRFGSSRKSQFADPQVTVDFLHTGWTSSWNQYVEETEG